MVGVIAVALGGPRRGVTRGRGATQKKGLAVSQLISVRPPLNLAELVSMQPHDKASAWQVQRAPVYSPQRPSVYEAVYCWLALGSGPAVGGAGGADL
jgi:hypothetical protein